MRDFTSAAKTAMVAEAYGASPKRLRKILGLKVPNYAAANKIILEALRGLGWAVVEDVDRPYATDPTRRVRFYFRIRSIAVDYAPVFSRNSATAIWCDAKHLAELTPEEIQEQLFAVAQAYRVYLGR